MKFHFNPGEKMIIVSILCTGNNCTSQMAHGFLKSPHKNPDVHSAGAHSSSTDNPFAIKVLNEIDMYLIDHNPVSIEYCQDKECDSVFTVYDDARETCRVFTASVKNNLNMAFDDPVKFS